MLWGPERVVSGSILFLKDTIFSMCSVFAEFFFFKNSLFF